MVCSPHVAVGAGSAAVVASDAGRMGSYESPIQISAAGIRWDRAWGLWFLICSSESILNVNLVKSSCLGKPTRSHFAESVSKRDFGWRNKKINTKTVNIWGACKDVSPARYNAKSRELPGIGRLPGHGS